MAACEPVTGRPPPAPPAGGALGPVEPVSTVTLIGAVLLPGFLSFPVLDTTALPSVTVAERILSLNALLRVPPAGTTSQSQVYSLPAVVAWHAFSAETISVPP